MIPAIRHLAWMPLFGLAVAAQAATPTAKAPSTKMVATTLKDADGWNEEGIKYFHLQEYGKAITAYQRALQMDPTYAKAYNNMANVHLAKHDALTAITLYQKAVALDPHYSEAYANMGIAYYHVNDFKKSIEAYQRAIKINQFYADAYCNMGVAYQRLNETDLAIQAFQTAVQITPKHGIALLNLGAMYHALGQPEKVKRIIEQLKKVDAVMANQLEDLIYDRVHLENPSDDPPEEEK